MTGDNGLLTRTGEARNTNIEAEGVERIQLAVMASHDNRGINTTSLAKNLSKISGLTDTNNQTITENTEIILPTKMKLNNIEYTIKENGTVSVIHKVKYNINSTISNGISSGTTIIEENGTALVTLSADNHYILPSSITVTGATHTYSSSTGIICLSNPTDNVEITAICLDNALYGSYTFNGTEDWQFHTSGEPNNYGIYNCYLMGSIPVNIQNEAKLKVYGFEEATTDNSYFNRLITYSESRANTKSAGYNIFAMDPSIFLDLTQR